MNYKYCGECAARLEKLSNSEYQCRNGHKTYNDPRGTVAVVFLKDGRFLASKRAREPAKGKFDLPGGFIQFGEDPYDAAMREIEEESGILIKRRDLKLVEVFTGPYTETESIVEIIFLAVKWKGEPKAADDTAGYFWKPLAFMNSPEFDPDYPKLINKLS